MADTGKDGSGFGGRFGHCEMMGDIREVIALIEERECILDLWHQLENHIATGPFVDFRTVHRDSPIGAESNTRLRVPRHVIDAMKAECERRRDEITAILVRNYGIKDA